MASREIETHSPEETIERGREIGAALKPPVLILLSGELGAGKTTLTKGLASGLGAVGEGEVTSPTFTLVHQYGREPRVFHVDLYRVRDFEDLETLGLEDIFSAPAAVIVEWAEKFSFRTGWPTVRIHLDHVSEDTRRISITEEPGELG